VAVFLLAMATRKIRSAITAPRSSPQYLLAASDFSAMDSFNQHLDILQYMTTPAKQMVVDVSGMYGPSCAMRSEPVLTACPIYSPSPSTERLSHRLLFPNNCRVSKKDAGLGNSSGTFAVECSIAHVTSLIVTLA
jgi:hypothetical protein